MARRQPPGPHPRVRLLVALLLFLAAPAGAQTRLYILFAGEPSYCTSGVCQPARFLDIDVDGRRLLADVTVRQATESPAGPVVTPDGTYLAWMGTDDASRALSCLSVLDTTARSHGPLLCAGLTWIGGTLLAHPAAVRLYAQAFSALGDATIVEPHGPRPFPLSCANAILGDISADGARLSVACVSRPLPGLVRTVVVDAETGQELGTVSGGTFVEMDTDGTHLYAAARPAADLEVSRHDVATGQRTGSRILGNAAMYGSAVHDARTGWLALGVLDHVSGATGIRVLDGTSLADVGSLSAPFPEAFAEVVFDPDRPAMYVLWHAATATGDRRSRLALYETTGFTSVVEADLGVAQFPVGMVLGPRPPRALALSAIVQDRVVTLGWTNETRQSAATGLVVEAGSAPGLANLARLSVAAGETSLTVPNVPPGTYFVRVRSVNGTGPGDPSNEVVVLVP